VTHLAVFVRDYVGTPDAEDRQIISKRFYREYPELRALAKLLLEELRRE